MKLDFGRSTLMIPALSDKASSVVGKILSPENIKYKISKGLISWKYEISILGTDGSCTFTTGGTGGTNTGSSFLQNNLSP